MRGRSARRAIVAEALTPNGEAPTLSVERGDHMVGVRGDVAEFEYVEIHHLVLPGRVSDIPWT